MTRNHLNTPVPDISKKKRATKRNNMPANSKVKWTIEADYLQACNCDFGCPCEFSAPPTYGDCQGTGAWKIKRGRFGKVKLDGLGFAFAAHWPKAIHEGNGTVCLFFDEKAKPEQRDALLRIASGKEGGLPFEILVGTFSKILEPQFVPFTFKFNGRNSSVKIGDAVSVAVEPIKNPVTGEPESVIVNHGTGFVFKKAECVSSKECRVAAGDINFSWPNRAAFVTKIKYGN
jgi:hypothetical protein